MSHCTMPGNEKSATVIRLKLCLNCLNSGHRVSNCNARGHCAKCKGKHHSSIHGIRIHNTSSNAPSQRSMTNAQPQSCTNTHAAIITADMPTAVTETVLNADPTTQSITTNCAPLLNINANDFLDDCDKYPSLPINNKPSYKV